MGAPYKIRHIPRNMWRDCFRIGELEYPSWREDASEDTPLRELDEWLAGRRAFPNYDRGDVDIAVELILTGWRKMHSGSV